MAFERGRSENGANRLEHGSDFAFAIRIFNGPVRRAPDRRAWPERRIAATGQAEGVRIAVVYTRGNGRYRIISARLARRNERFRWSRGKRSNRQLPRRATSSRRESAAGP